MRDIKRIEPIVKKIEKLWKENQDLRFWQLINLIVMYTPENKVNTDPFFWEDDTWDKMLDKALEGKK